MSGRRSLSMDYDDPSDSSGTDDDLPPTHSGGRASRGVKVSGNGRAGSGAIYASTHSSQPATTSSSSSVDLIIHKLEQEAYTAVLRAFGAQSEHITWDKERLMSDLRKELRVSDEQHREFLGRVGADDTIRQIHSMYRQLGGPAPIVAPAAVAAAPAAEISPPPPAPSQSRKKQKTALVPPPPPSTTPTPPLPPHSKSAPVQSSSGTKRGVPGPRGGKKQKGGRVPAGPKGPGGSKVGRPSSKVLENPSEMSIDPFVGRRVKTKWPDDNAFYEAVITDYNPSSGCHALVYDIDTIDETWEWVNLKDMPPGDLKWVEGPNAVVTGKKAPPPGARTMGRGMKRGPKGSMASPGGKAKTAGRGSGVRGWRGPSSAENGSRGPVELIPLEDLAKEVDKLEEEDDLVKLESAKRAAKAHEESIRKALAEVGESSDEAESDDGGQPPSSHTQSIDHDRERRSGQNSRDHTADSDEEETAGNERGEASDGEHTAGEGGGASDAYDDQQGEDGDDKDEEG